MIARLLLFLLLGACTGAVVFLPPRLFPGANEANAAGMLVLVWILLAPGAIFGAATAIALRRLRLLPADRAMLWAATATGSHAAAFIVTLLATLVIGKITPDGPNAMRMVGSLAGMVGGCLGGSALAAIAAPHLRRQSVPILILTGTLMGALLGLPLTDGVGDSISGTMFIVFYALWQGTYAAVLAWRLDAARP